MRNALSWLVISLVSVTLTTAPALARAGGGRSFGRSFNRGGSGSGMGSGGFGMRQRPTPNPYPLSQPQQDYRAPATPPPSSIPNYRSEPAAAPAAASRGGFLRNMAGGLAGGFLGSMLFNSVGRAMGGGYGAGPVDGGYGVGGGGYGVGGSRGGIGLFELMLIAGLGYLGYRLFRARQSTPAAASATGQVISFRMPPSETASTSTAAPLDSETASDIFFRVQGAWTRRDLGSIQDLLGDDVRSVLQNDLNELRRQKQINRLENISVREVDVGETWRDGDSDVATVRFHANLLDYTVDEGSHQVLAGSDSVPVKFVEDWTFARHGRSDTWQVVGISQAQ